MRFSAFAVLAVLTACAGPHTSPWIGYVDQTTLYSRDLVNYAAQGGEFAVVIVGNPFPQAVDAEAMAAAIPWPGHFTRARMTTQPGTAARRNLRVVFVFNPAWRGPGIDDVCADPGALATAPPASPSRPTRLAATFCADDRAVSWLVAEGDIGTGPGDPRYAALMGQAMLSLLPPAGPNERESNRPCGFGC